MSKTLQTNNKQRKQTLPLPIYRRRFGDARKTRLRPPATGCSRVTDATPPGCRTPGPDESRTFVGNSPTPATGFFSKKRQRRFQEKAAALPKVAPAPCAAAASELVQVTRKSTDMAKGKAKGGGSSSLVAHHFLPTLTKPASGRVSDPNINPDSPRNARLRRLDLQGVHASQEGYLPALPPQVHQRGTAP